MNGKIERVNERAEVEGWVIYPARSMPATVQIKKANEILAETVADIFRPDLLEGGLGHGYHGFCARLTTLIPSSSYDVELVEAATQLVICSCVIEINSYPLDESPQSIHGLLANPVVWTDEQVLRNLSALRLRQNLEALGYNRFVDCCYYYLLGRWADEDGLTRYAQALETGEHSPDEVFRILATCGERKDRSSQNPLASPYDYRFPFSG